MVDDGRSKLIPHACFSGEGSKLTGRTMMVTSLNHNHNHLSYEQHHGTPLKLGHSVDDEIRIGNMPNYIESDSTILASHGTIHVANHQRSQETNSLAMSICLQPPTTNTSSTQAAAPLPPLLQHQTNHDHWPGSVTTNQWTNNHKFYIVQDLNGGQKPPQTHNETFYNYLQTTFAPTTSYGDSMMRLSDSAAKTSGDSKQVQYYGGGINDHQHYYSTATTNQAYTNYNIDEYASSTQRHTAFQQQQHQQQEVNRQYHETNYQDNNQTSAFNQTAPINESSASSSSLYQNYHQNYSNSSTKITAANRFSLVEADERRQQADHQAAAGFWASHQYQSDYGRAPLSHQQHDINSVQTNYWLDKTCTRVPHHVPYQNQESTYDYYRPDCLPEQACTANDADAASVTYGQTITRRSPSSSATNYQQDEQTRVAADTSDIFTCSKRNSVSEMAVDPKAPIIQSSGKMSATDQLVKNDELKDKRPNDQQPVSSVMTHNGSNSTPQTDRLNQCRICGRHYARPSTLKTHLRTHTNERPYKCAVCCKTFSQAANLTAHQRVHTGERPFPCPICGRQFSQSSSVITHLRTHSGERPYRCNMCNRTFSDSSTLTKHCRIHSGEKPYQCDYCPMNFSQSGNLSRHLRLHSIGGLNKTHQNMTAAATAAAVAPSTTTTTTAPTINQRNHSSNPSSSPESTLSSYSIFSRISSGASNSTSSSSSG